MNDELEHLMMQSHTDQLIAVLEGWLDASPHVTQADKDASLAMIRAAQIVLLTRHRLEALFGPKPGEGESEQ